MSRTNVSPVVVVRPRVTFAAALHHTAAHRWLAVGGSESGLMAIAGWTRADMLIR